MPQVVDANGNTLAEFPYDAAGMRQAEEFSTQVPGSHIQYQNNSAPGEFSQQAMGEQTQIDADMAAGQTAQMMNPDPRIMSGQTQGMY